MSIYETLLAKSIRSREPQESDEEHKKLRDLATFKGHIAIVCQSAKFLLENIGESTLAQLGLSDSDYAKLAATVKLAAYLHDWGKANQHFQDMVHVNSAFFRESKNHKQLHEIAKKSWRNHGGSQLIRHELISGILALGELRSWLEQCPEADLKVAVCAVLGHHLKLDKAKIADFPNGSGSEILVFTGHRNFTEVLNYGQKFLGLPEPPKLQDKSWSRQELEDSLEQIADEFDDFHPDSFIGAVKSLMICADLAGSALNMSAGKAQEWMKEVLSCVLETKDLDKVLQKRLCDDSGQCRPLRPFQEAIANTSQRVTLVQAGCGTGKTVAAYAWAKNRAIDRKLFFCYPTTGTATQGFIDYPNSTDVESALMHSRSDLDRELLFSGEYEAEGVEARLTAMQAWTKKIIVCTVDTVLGLMQNNRRPLNCFPALVRGAFVFDEVHAYDDRLFTALLRFLETFRGAPVLLMSASLSDRHKQAIRKTLEKIGEQLQELPGYAALEEIPRYRFTYLPEADNAESGKTLKNQEKIPLEPIWAKINQALAKGEKILWVTNSVQTCIEIYQQAKEKLSTQFPDLKLLIYHSRFKYRDRVEKHNQVIDAFDPNEGPCLAITTQVCEMSLDLSADLLITAMAPAAALIQRLGRLNRRVEETAPGKFSVPGIREAVIYPWDGLPYRAEEMHTGIWLVEELKEELAISQTTLATKLAEKLVAADQPSLDDEEIPCLWLKQTWETYPDSLRDIDGTISVLLEKDLPEIKKKAEERKTSFTKEAQGWSVQMRFMKGCESWKRCKFYMIAPSDAVAYDPDTGAEPCRP